MTPTPATHALHNHQQRSAHIRSVVMARGDELRQRYPILKHQDAIGAGILMYTGLVELLAHEFMFNPQMRSARLRVQLFAFACVLFGVFVMSLLAEWA